VPANGWTGLFHLNFDAQPLAMKGFHPVSVPLLLKVKAEHDALGEAKIIPRVIKPTAGYSAPF
jgi:hypothetical protein